MTFAPLAPFTRRVASVLLAAGCMMVLTACPSDINGRVDRVSGPISGGSGGGGTGGGPISGGGGTGGGGTGEVHDAFVTVEAGSGTTCALTAEGRAYCWGYNKEGQLGNGTQSNALSPKAVVTEERFVTLAVGGSTNCGITAAGVMWCWGSTWRGLTGTTGARDLVPARVQGSIVWKTMRFGQRHRCGIDVAGVAYCWGDNGNGELGIGAFGPDSVATPTPVVGGRTWTHIMPGDAYTCGRTTESLVYCWGTEFSTPHLGSPGGTTHTPRQVASTTAFATVSASFIHACALEADFARVSCWGDPRASGAEGVGAGIVPTRVGLEQDLLAVSSGALNSCAITASRRLWCWGLNSYGQLGTGNTMPQRLPVELPSPVGFSHVSVGAYHACGIGMDGNTYCWGTNAFGELGNGKTSGFTPNAPVLVLRARRTRQR